MFKNGKSHAGFNSCVGIMEKSIRRKGGIAIMFKFTHAITQELMDTIATYMDDEIREQVHAEIAPCEPEEFLRRYLELDSEFSELLESFFGIEMD